MYTKEEMKQQKIGVIAGGPSAEADVSRNTGKAVVKALQTLGYDAEMIELVPDQFVRTMAEKKIDVVFNALHGKYGEDGILQGMCEMLGIPYTGSGVMASAVGMSKVISKCVFQGAQIPTAPFAYYFLPQGLDSIIKDIKNRFTFPVVIKSSEQGSTIGTVIVPSEAEIKPALDEVFRYGDAIIAEAFIDGDEFTVAVMNEEVFPVIQIISRTGRYDYYSKYTPGASVHLCPAPITPELTRKMQNLALQVFRLCQCSGIARVDIMTDKHGSPFVLEINTMPGMTATSLVPDAAAAMGVPFDVLCEKILLEASVGKC